jgi:hypothetical protein
MQQFPALQRIPLNDSIVTLEWLCRGEEGNHRTPPERFLASRGTTETA